MTLGVVAPGVLCRALVALGGCSGLYVREVTVVTFSAVVLFEECTHIFVLLRSTLLILRAFTAFGKFITELWSAGGGPPPPQ